MATSSLITGTIRNGYDNNTATLELLEELQAAIANGEHEKASHTAGILARLKVNFNMKELAPPVPQSPTSTLDVLIEDQSLTSSIKINPSMTISELEMKIFNTYKIPIHNKRLVFVKTVKSKPEDDKKSPSSVSTDALSLPSTSAEWRCSSCTLANPISEKFCNVCNRSQIYHSLENNGTSPDTLSLPSTAAEWQCSSCTLVNPISEKFCGACDRSQTNHIVETNENNTESCRWINKNTEQETREQKFANYQELLHMDKNDLITNLEDFECPICMTIYFPGEGVILKTCLHMFCKDCLAQLIIHNTDAEIKCPYTDNDCTCESFLQEREIKALVSVDVYEKYLARSVTEAESKIQNTFHCKTMDCESWCIIEEEVNEFHCPVCDKVNCLTCQAIHTQLNCKQYQEIINKDSAMNEEAKKTKLKFETMLKKGEAMACPTCNVIIMKKTGCDSVICTMCKTLLCWATKGARWGPKGPGDISGGCRCLINGKKCHPKCTGCH